MPKREFPGRLNALHEIGHTIAQAARETGLDDEDAYDVELSVIEACTNIIEHGYHCEGEQKIICTWENIPHGIKIVLKDTACAFDPKNAPPPQVGVALEDLKAGGAGVFLMLKLMDEVKHEFIPAEGNILTMIKRRSKGRRRADRLPGHGLPALPHVRKPQPKR